jgi:hypothetical protein
MGAASGISDLRRIASVTLGNRPVDAPGHVLSVLIARLFGNRAGLPPPCGFFDEKSDDASGFCPGLSVYISFCRAQRLALLNAGLTFPQLFLKPVGHVLSPCRVSERCSPSVAEQNPPQRGIVPKWKALVADRYTLSGAVPSACFGREAEIVDGRDQDGRRRLQLEAPPFAGEQPRGGQEKLDGGRADRLDLRPVDHDGACGGAGADKLILEMGERSHVELMGEIDLYFVHYCSHAGKERSR